MPGQSVLEGDIMLALAIAIAVDAAPAISNEAENLGRRLAATSGIATMAPLLIEKDLEELSKEAPILTPAEKRRLLELGHEEGRRGVDRLISALGHAYASRLSVSDLRVLVAQNEGEAAVRRRALEPSAIMETMRVLGQIDLKKNVAAAFCNETGKLCHR
jgi:hypothetical protein